MNNFLELFPYLLGLVAIGLTFAGLLQGFAVGLHALVQIPALKSTEARCTSFFIGLNSFEPFIGLGVSCWWVVLHFIDILNLEFPFPYPSVLLGLGLAIIPLFGLAFKKSTYLGLSLAQSAMMLSRWTLNAIFVWLGFNSQYRDAIFIPIVFGPIWLIINFAIVHKQVSVLRKTYLQEIA